jgi:deoxyribonuclease IV
MRRMLPDGRRLGAHLPLATGMVRAVERAHAIGADTIQIFSDNPTAWKRRAAPPPELAAFRDRLTTFELGPVAIHASYLINLAGPDPVFFERSVDLLTHELRTAPTFAARFVNVHIGSHRDTGIHAGIERVAEAVARVLDAVEPTPDEAMLVLENSAGSGWGVGTDIDELAGIAEAAARRGVPRERLGFCLDTAHAWGAGIDVGDPRAIDGFLADWSSRIGLDRLVMLHCNDSRSALGSRLDRHEHLGAGRIGAAGLRHLLTHPDLRHVTTYLETPGMDTGYDAVNIERAHAIVRGDPLPVLPPEAFEQRSAAARTGPAA